METKGNGVCVFSAFLYSLANDNKEWKGGGEVIGTFISVLLSVGTFKDEITEFAAWPEKNIWNITNEISINLAANISIFWNSKKSKTCR